MESIDGGKTWAAPKQQATIKGKVDYPQMIQSQDSVYLVVNSHKQGLMSMKLN